MCQLLANSVIPCTVGDSVVVEGTEEDVVVGWIEVVVIGDGAVVGAAIKIKKSHTCRSFIIWDRFY